MQCEEFEDRLNAVLDERGRVEWDAELDLHRETCPVCRHLASAYDTLLEGFFALAAPQAPEDMSLRVMAELTARPAERRRTFSRKLLAAVSLATAACLLVMAAHTYQGARSAAQIAAADDAKVTGQSDPASATRTALEQFPLVPELLAIAESPDGDPYAGLAKETGQGLANVMLFVPGVGGSRGIIDAEDSAADGSEDDPAWAVQMSEGLKPLTDSVTDTVNLLLRSLPVDALASR
jgi:hypothetical protein